MVELELLERGERAVTLLDECEAALVGIGRSWCIARKLRRLP